MLEEEDMKWLTQTGVPSLRREEEMILMLMMKISYDFLLAFNTYHYIFSREGKCEAYIFGGCENLSVLKKMQIFI